MLTVVSYYLINSAVCGSRKNTDTEFHPTRITPVHSVLPLPLILTHNTPFLRSWFPRSRRSLAYKMSFCQTGHCIVWRMSTRHFVLCSTRIFYKKYLNQLNSEWQLILLLPVLLLYIIIAFRIEVFKGLRNSFMYHLFIRFLAIK
jgi:hypothetical protein